MNEFPMTDATIAAAKAYQQTARTEAALRLGEPVTDRPFLIEPVVVARVLIPADIYQERRG